MDMLILTEKGILNSNKINLYPPFDGRLIHHGTKIGDKIAVIVDRKQIWLYQNKWEKLTESKLQLNCLQWLGSEELLVGTEKARLASVNHEMEFIRDFDELENRSKWSTPWGGPPDVRSLAGNENVLYANIHVGWIVRSLDQGKSWQSITNGLAKDVHMVTTDPLNPNIVMTATARGFHISTDYGENFKQRWNIPLQYQRATFAFPDKNIYLVSVSKGSSGGSSELYRSEDQGKTWHNVIGLPQNISNNINTYQITGLKGGKAYVIIENEKIFKSTDYGYEWELLIDDLPKSYQVILPDK